jgi:hypothetical protein
VPSAVDDTTSLGKYAVEPSPVAPDHTGVFVGQLAFGFGVADIISCESSSLRIYNVSFAPGVSVVDVIPPDETEATATTVAWVVADRGDDSVVVAVIVYVPAVGGSKPGGTGLGFQPISVHREEPKVTADSFLAILFESCQVEELIDQVLSVGAPCADMVTSVPDVTTVSIGVR